MRYLNDGRTQKQAALMAGVSNSVAWKVYHGGYRKILTDQAPVIEMKEKKVRGKLFNPNDCINWIV